MEASFSSPAKASQSNSKNISIKPAEKAGPIDSSRYPKASALGLSTSNENGALAPGVVASRSETISRPATGIEPDLTPDQQALDQRLRDWRKSESERLGLPQFFVFGSSALRTIVTKHPRTLPELRALAALDHEKLEKYGPGIVAVCNA